MITFKWLFNLVQFFTLGGGPSGGGGSQTSTTYSSNLPEYAKPYYTELLKQTGKNVFSTDQSGNVTGVKPYTPYTGERTAGFTDLQNQAQGEIGAMGTPNGFNQAANGMNAAQMMGFGSGAQGLGSALAYRPQQVGTDMFGQAAADYYSNPYQQNVTNTALREARLQGDLNKQKGMLGSIGRGTFGGARQALLQAEQERGTQQGMNDIQYKGMADAYNNAQSQFNADQTRGLQAQQANQTAMGQAAGINKDIGIAGLGAGLDASKAQGALSATQQTADLERLKAQATTGAEQQALQQKIDDLAYQTSMEARDWQQKQLEFYSNILRGNAGALGSTQVQYNPAPSAASQIGGLGIAGLGLYNAIK